MWDGARSTSSRKAESLGLGEGYVYERGTGVKVD